MSTIRVNDMVCVFHGGFTFAQKFDVETDVNLKPYNAGRAKLNHGRSLFLLARGADGDVQANVDEILNMLKGTTQGKFETIGQVCLLGRSNGCSLALGLAAELNAKGVAELTFVGVSDVTFFPGGRTPPVPRIGDLKPENDPIPSSASAPGGLKKAFQQPVPDNTIPFVKPGFDIKAKAKINHYQKAGNHMKYAVRAAKWIWWSDMTDGEVHGKMEGFENRELNCSGNSDLDFHVDLNTQQHWKNLCAEASRALATFPPDAQ